MKFGYFEKVFRNGAFRRILPFILIFIFTVGLYARAIGFGFTYLDDNVLIIKNQPFLHNPSNILKAFQTDVFISGNGAKVYYRPALTLTFMLGSLLGGSSPAVYHFINVFFHFLTTLLVFFTLLELRYSRKKSLAAALVFATHPAISQAIGWIPGLNDIVLGFFVFLSFFAFLKFISSSKKRWYFLHALSFLMALLSKESALVLPLLCLFYYFFIRKERMLSNKTLVLAIGWLTSAIVWLSLRSMALGNGLGYGIKETLQSLLSGIPAFIPYIGKILFPFHLSVFPIMRDSLFIPGFVGIALLAFLVIIQKKCTPAMWFGITWFILFIFPSLIQIGINPPVFHEHRLYVPLLGFLIFGLEILPIFKDEEKRKALQKVAISFILVFSILSLLRLPVFKERFAFWRNAIATSPNSAFSRNNLGAMYYLDGDTSNAEIEFKKALALNPLEPLVHNNIGLIYAAYGDFKNARGEFLKELEINPTYDDARKNLDSLSQKNSPIIK